MDLMTGVTIASVMTDVIHCKYVETQRFTVNWTMIQVSLKSVGGL